QSSLNDRDTIGLGPGTTFLFLLASNGSLQPNAPPPPSLAPSAPGRDFQSPQVANPAYARQTIGAIFLSHSSSVHLGRLTQTFRRLRSRHPSVAIHGSNSSCSP